MQMTSAARYANSRRNAAVSSALNRRRPMRTPTDPTRTSDSQTALKPPINKQTSGDQGTEAKATGGEEITVILQAEYNRPKAPHALPTRPRQRPLGGRAAPASNCGYPRPRDLSSVPLTLKTPRHRRRRTGVASGCTGCSTQRRGQSVQLRSPASMRRWQYHKPCGIKGCTTCRALGVLEDASR